ncbi:PaaI family thioesterase [Pelagibius litoralis]|uniref:PaaI family thioesterase n=1 Tax=Pelagibius litoralis TaxID=374515 RepID=A0A967KC98_9PROT|nr:PaaI family thioesterase [Pelagibius litoralis]NIA70754.1 PaaI family thioesterase [Pelagibius litoralis]
MSPDSGDRVTSGLIPVETVRALSGLALLQGMVEGRFPPPPMAELLGFMLDSVAAGEAIFRGVPDRRHYNPLGTVHGGYAATLLDSAMGCAVHSTLQIGEGYTTMEFKVHLVRAMTEGVGDVLAKGAVIHRGRRSATAEAKLVDADGKLYAHGTTTCMILAL